MSLIYECDSCKRPITQAELDAREALVFQGQHYCSSCKSPVLAFMRKNMEANKGESTGDSPASSVVGGDGNGAAKTAPSSRAPQPSGPSKTPASGQAGQQAGQTGSSESPSSSKTSSSKTSSSKLTSKSRTGTTAKFGARKKDSGPVAKRPGLTKRAGVTKNVPGKAALPKAGASARSAPGGSPRAPSEPTSRTSARSRPSSGLDAPGRKPGKRAPLGAGKRRLGRLGSRTKAVDPEFDDEAVPARRRSPAIIVTGSLALVIVAFVIVVVLNSDKSDSPAALMDNTGATSSAASVGEKTPAELEMARIQEEMQRDKDILNDLRDRFVGEGDPLRLKSLLGSVNRSAYRVRSPQIGDDLKRLGREVKEKLEKTLKLAFEDAKSKSDKLVKEDNYGVAMAIWENEPASVQDSPYHAEWVWQRDQLSRLAKKYSYWSMIALKVGKYLEQGNPEVSIAIIRENIGEDYERDFPTIWKKRESLLSKVRDAKGKALESALAVARAEREKREEIERLRIEKERAERWDRALGLIDWEPLISANGDLENWYQQFFYTGRLEESYFAWSVDTEDKDNPVLTTDNRERNHSVAIAYNGDRWQDWALKFEVQVPKKSLTMELRNVLRGNRVKADRDIIFSKSYRKKWIPVYLEVRAKQIRFYKNADEETAKTMKPTKTIECEHESGGFRFHLPKGGHCKIRNMQLKLVSAFAPGEETDDDEDDL
jgi:hypothetical protein